MTEIGRVTLIKLPTYNKETRKAERNSFKKFCTDIDSTPIAARLHKVMAKGDTVMALRKIDGSFTESEGERALL